MSQPTIITAATSVAGAIPFRITGGVSPIS